MQKTIVFIIPRNPYPAYSGFAKHCFSIAQELKKFNYKLILISLNLNISKDFIKDFKNSPFDKHYRLKLNILDYLYLIPRTFFSLLKAHPIQLSLFASPFFKTKLSFLIKKINLENDISFFHIFSIRTFYFWSLIDKYNKPFLVDLIDSVGLTFERYSQNSNKIISLFYKLEAFTLKKFESSLPNFKNLKAYSLVSDIDKRRINIKNNSNSINKIYSYPIGLDMPLEKNLFRNKKNTYQIIFFGSLAYKPNIRAVLYFIEEILPIVLENLPDLNFLITGYKPPKSLLKICSKNKNINVISNPKNINKLIRKSTISIAPMISGSGQQNKVIESMSLKVPVILTSLAANPLKLKSMKNCIVADDPINFAKAIILLLKNKSLREKIYLNAFEFVKENHKWDNIVSRLVNEIYP